MDLIRELKDVRFELNLRGYDCDAVDAFLAKIRGEVAELQSERERAQERADSLESGVGAESDTEGTLRRTLVLAQRLADETVADAKQTAESMVESAAAEAAEVRETAQSESDSLLASANEEAAKARDEAHQELLVARDDAARTAEEVAIAEKKARDEAVERASQILADAEAEGVARIASLEDAARAEIGRSREPLRAEVGQLEQTRESLLNDIAALEEHLVDQRTRVRTAVEALRAGMSGSIDDLERVATDDDAMSSAPRPTLEDRSSADIDEAPDFNIAAAVNEAAGSPVNAEEIANRVGPDDVVDAELVEESAEAADEVVVDEVLVDEVVVDEVLVDEVVVDDVAVDEVSVDDAASAADGEFFDPGPATELIPVVKLSDDDDTELVDLDAEPSALFGTDVADLAEVVDADSSPLASPVLEDAVLDDPDVGDTSGETGIDGEDAVEPTEGSDDGTSTFLTRFTEAIGDLPVVGKS